jgi:EAL domain-containing protein (putative c-di-GMP-specific phosphodiesterase class I)
MANSPWSDWQIAQLNECLMQGIGPAETAALVGKTKDDVCTKMRELRYVHYQPIVDRAGVATVGVEALVRWSREGKSISPAEFIPLAERNGSIHQIGEWVLSPGLQRRARMARTDVVCQRIGCSVRSR